MKVREKWQWLKAELKLGTKQIACYAFTQLSYQVIPQLSDQVWVLVAELPGTAKVDIKLACSVWVGEGGGNSDCNSHDINPKTTFSTDWFDVKLHV